MTSAPDDFAGTVPACFKSYVDEDRAMLESLIAAWAAIRAHVTAVFEASAVCVVASPVETHHTIRGTP